MDFALPLVSNGELVWIDTTQDEKTILQPLSTGAENGEQNKSRMPSFKKHSI